MIGSFWRRVAAIGALCVGSTAASAIEIEVLSGRPQLVTGGDTLVRIGDSATAPIVMVGGVDRSAVFTQAADGDWIGLVDGLVDGDTELTASAGGASASLTLTNHPINGTLLAGPQQTPFLCEHADLGLEPTPDARLDPLDADCAAVTTVSYFYRDNEGDWHPFDAEAPRPRGIAMTTTSEGVAAPLIVRQEKGVINRAAYVINILHDPAAGPPPSPTDRGGSAWNGRLIYSFGGGVQANYHQGRRFGDLDARFELMEEYNVGFRDAFITGGYAIASGSLNVFATNADDVKSAETAIKIKERFIEEFGPPLFTIGHGVSGGSMQQHLIANAYPGVLDGIMPGRSYADTMTFLQPLYDCELLANVFKQGDWSRAQREAVSGKYWGYCVSNGTRYPVARPDNCDLAVVFLIETEPAIADRGVRCTYQDNMINVFGTDPATGFARNPFDNVGVQYGLTALNDGVISFDQFLDINQRIGGLDSDGRIMAERMIGDADALAIAYRTGRVMEGTGGAGDVPIVSIRSYNDGDPINRGDANVDVHDGYHSRIVEARLQKYTGTSANYVQLITATLGFPQLDAQTPGSPLNVVSVEALDSIDHWLTAIRADTSQRSKAEKVAANRPAGLVDACYPTKPSFLIGEIQKLTDRAECEALFPMYADARIAAGGPLTADIFKCQLKPVAAADYGVPPSAEQLARLRAIFPDGVCDYSRPGVGQTQDVVTWAIFSGNGDFAALND